MVTIIPTIWVRTWEEFETRFERVKDLVERVHVDIADGVFVDYKTFGPEELVRASKPIRFDAHLMVDEPIKWLNRCVQGGVERVFAQVERMGNIEEFVAECQLSNLRVGLAIDINTEVGLIESVVDDVDAVLLMAYPAGVEGQKFDDRVLAKIEQVRKINRDVLICVDGGLDVEEIIKCLSAEWAEEIKEDRLHEDFLNMEFMVGRRLTEAVDVATELERFRHLKNNAARG